ncbi:MAG TPA: kelch repeat-containing protein [Acidobacteriota bacterium]|nr:kelch repeat-containing protein [Acidobacteriota bacterium]
MKSIHLMSLFTFALTAIFSQSGYTQSTTYYLPHVANGSFDSGSYRTTFVMFNNSDVSVNTSLKLTKDDGSPLSASIPQLGTGSQFSFTLPRAATRIYQTDGSGALATGAATVSVSSPIGVSGIFTIYGTNQNYLTEAGVGSSQPLTEFAFPVDVTGSFNTGLALFNPSSGAANITFNLYDTDGNKTATASLPVPLRAGGHSAFFLAGPRQLFPAVSNFRGTVLVQSSLPVAALVLRENDTPLSFTSLPVVDRSSISTTLYLPHVADGSYETGKFKTSFIVFNPYSTNTDVDLSFTKADGSPLTVTIQGITSSDFRITSLSALNSIFFETSGSGPLAAGAAVMTSSVPIGASGIFSLYDSGGAFQTEAGVGTSRPMASMTLPVDFTGSYNTGVAFYNPAASAVTPALRLLDSDGVVVGWNLNTTLDARGHAAKFVNELFPGISNFRGLLSVSGAGTGIVGLTLRQNSGPLSYTTLPVVASSPSGVQSIAAPSGLSATSLSSSSIRLAWTDNSNNETSFKVERGTSLSGPFTQIATVNTNVTTYDDSGLSASTTYAYRLRSSNPGGDSGYSNVASATTQAAVPPPSAPTGLTAVTQNSSAIQLAWTDNSTNETGFEVERAAAAAGPFYQIASLGANVTTFTDSGLVASSTYSYRILAFNSGGNSAYSNVASAKTTASSSGGFPLSISLASSSYWDYFWITETEDFAQGSGTSYGVKTGKFRVALGTPASLAGLTAFPVTVTGTSSDGVTDFAPDWKHLAVSADSSLMGSTDGSTFSLVYSAQSTKWNGGGFFVPFPSDQGITSSTGVFPGEYNQVNSMVVGRQASSGGCVYYPSVGQTICSGDPTSISEHEYYLPGVGPIGYKLAISVSSSGGGFYTSNKRTSTVELTGTSFTASDGTVFSAPPWQDVKPLGTPRRSHAAVALSGKIYVIGGLDSDMKSLSSVEIYDPAGDTWTAGVPLPVAMFRHTAEVVAGKIYVIPSNGSAIRIFDPGTNTWSTGPNAPYSDPAHGSCAMFDDYVVVATPNGAFSGSISVPIYQISTGKWGWGTAYPTSDRRWFSVACIGGDMYLAGGYTQFMSTKTQKTMLKYHATTPAAWTTLSTAMNEARELSAAVALNGKIVVLGGEGSSGPLRSNEAYNPLTATWESVPSMLRPREEFDAVVLNGSIYAIGGISGGTVLGQVERYTPK